MTAWGPMYIRISVSPVCSPEWIHCRSCVKQQRTCPKCQSSVTSHLVPAQRWPRGKLCRAYPNGHPSTRADLLANAVAKCVWSITSRDRHEACSMVLSPKEANQCHGGKLITSDPFHPGRGSDCSWLRLTHFPSLISLSTVSWNPTNKASLYIQREPIKSKGVTARTNGPKIHWANHRWHHVGTACW